MSAPPSDSVPPTGINIQQALTILSARSRNRDHLNDDDVDDNGNRDPTLITDSHSANDGHSCCHGMTVPEHVKTMGQTIDLFAMEPSPYDNDDDDDKKEPSIERKQKQQQQQQQLEEERAKRRQKLQAELESMTIIELLQAVFRAQQDRVATYKEYERYVIFVSLFDGRIGTSFQRPVVYNNTSPFAIGMFYHMLTFGLYIYI